MASFDVRGMDNDVNLDDNLSQNDLGFYGPGIVGRTLGSLPFYLKHFNPDESTVSGTGNFAPILRVNGDSTLIGFNTDIDYGSTDQKNAQLDIDNSWTNSVRLGDIPILYRDLNSDGTAEGYYELRLDINENNANDVALEEFQIFTSTTQATLAAYRFDDGEDLAFRASDGFIERINLDEGGDNRLIMSDEDSGQGRDDYVFYLPVSEFSGALSSNFFTIFAQFGPEPPDDAGFSEFRIQAAGHIIGLKFKDIDGNGLRDADGADNVAGNGDDESGLAGFVMYLDINNDGIRGASEPTTLSLADGSFTFDSLLPGMNYVVREDLTGVSNYTLTTGVAGAHVVNVATSGNYSVLVGNMPQIPAIDVIKTAGARTDGDANGDDAGDSQIFNFTVTNTGNIALLNVTLVDDNGTVGTGDDVTVTLTGLTDVDGDGQADDLAVGAAATGSLSHSFTQAEVDAGTYTNTGTARGTGTNGTPVSDSDPETVALVRTPAIDVVKTAGARTDVAGTIAGDSAGDTQIFNFTVTNTGNVSLLNVTLVDDNGTAATGDDITVTLTGLTDLDGDGQADDLAVGAAATGSLTHTFSQAQVDAGGYTNTGTARGTGTNGTPVSDTDPETVTLVRTPAIDVVKTAGARTDVVGTIAGDSAGDTQIFNFTVTNTGNVSLLNVTLVDDNGTAATGDDITVTLTGLTDLDGDGQADDLAVGAAATGSITHTFSQAQVDAGTYTNTGTARGTGTNGTPVSDTDPETVTLVRTPAIDVVKTAGARTDVAGTIVGDSAGDTQIFNFTVTNTGNVSLLNVTLVDDNGTAATGDDITVTLTGLTDLDGDGQADDLAVGAAATGSLTHTFSQAQVDAGTYTNTGTARGTGTNGAPVSDTDPETVTLTRNPVIDVVKTAGARTDVAGTIVGDSAGDTQVFNFTVTNTGNISLLNVTLVDDNGTAGTGDDITVTLTGLTDLDGDGQADDLAVGAAATGSITHTFSQAQVDAGTYTNTGTARGTGTNGTPVSDTDPETVTLTRTPAIDVVKTAGTRTDVAGTIAGDSAGDTQVFNFTVTNTGNISLLNVSLVDDNGTADTSDDITVTLTGLSDLDGDGSADDLAVGGAATGSITHTFSQAQVDAGTYTNTGTARGTGTNGTPVSDTDPETVTLARNPLVTIVKQVSVDGGLTYSDADTPTGPEVNLAGGLVYFKMIVTNTGNVTLTNTEVLDPYFDLNGAAAGMGWSVGGDGILSPGESHELIVSAPFTPGQHVNTATVTTAQGATDFDLAHYFGLVTVEGPGVRTPGFWSNLGAQFWDENLNNQTKVGPCFPTDELLRIDSNKDGVIDLLDSGLSSHNGTVGLLVGDYDRDGVQDAGEDILFISLADAKTLINASSKMMSDGAVKLGRDVVATWLNYLAGNGIGEESDTNSPRHLINDAVDWLQAYADATPGVAIGEFAETFDVYSSSHVAVKTNLPIWTADFNGDTHSAFEMHTMLDTYNNIGKTIDSIDGTIYAHDCDDPAFVTALTMYQSSHPDSLI